MSAIVRQCTVEELEREANFTTLISEYSEYAIKGMPRPVVKMEMYKLLEATGNQHLFGAFFGDILIGFMAVLISAIPHYGVLGAFSESLFVAKKYRKTGAGAQLINMAEELAKDKGAPGLLISAPLGGALSSVLPRRGYSATHSIFFKGFCDA